MIPPCKRRKSRIAAKKASLSRAVLERTTDLFFSDMGNVNPAQGDEACMTEGGYFVGTTALFDENWEIKPLNEELRPKK